MKEIKALEKNEIWDIIEISKGKVRVGCKWVFNIKYKADVIIVQRDLHKYIKFLIPKHLYM